MKLLKRIAAIIAAIGLLLCPMAIHNNYLENEAEALAENIIEFEIQRHFKD